MPYTVGAADRAIVNIADNEDPLAPVRAVVSVVPLDPSGTETPGGTDPVVFRINRTTNLTPALTVRYALGGTATRDADYTSPPATITIPAGAAFVDVPVAPIDDPFIEPAETVIFTLLPTDVTGTPLPSQAYAVDTLAGTATGTIFSDDLPPRPALTITAPGTNGAAASGRPFTVNFTASAANGYITHYNVNAGGGTSAFGGANLPAATPAVSLQVTDVLAYHELWPGRTASFAVTRSGGDLSQSLAVNYTVGGSATNGVGYVALPGVITIPAGGTQATILVNPYTAYSGHAKITL